MQPIYSSVEQLQDMFAGSLSFSPTLVIVDQQKLQRKDIDILIYNAQFALNNEVKKYSCSLIYQLCDLLMIQPSSIKKVYQAFAENKLKDFSTPALNVRTLTYDLSRLIFRLMLAKQIGAVVFELSRTEMVYTDQPPEIYAVAVLAAAIKEGYQGPVFLQGDHFQFNPDAFATDKQKEISDIKELIAKAVKAKFFNIDIDASTLVDLKQSDLHDQQQLNAEMTALLSTYIRSIEPPDQVISIGAEIGHIGDKNSTPDDLRAFMDIYQTLFPKEGITKVSVQTGTKHGGTFLSDGTLEKVALDFSILRDIGELARKTYHIGGVVQHGASTLPDDNFDKFALNNTLEVHLATGLQNIIYEALPIDVARQLEAWSLAQKPTGSTDTDEQFIYKTRKKALGPFKQQLWNIDENSKDKIITKLEQHLLIIFEKLRIFNTREQVLSSLTK